MDIIAVNNSLRIQKRFDSFDEITKEDMEKYNKILYREEDREDHDWQVYSSHSPNEPFTSEVH